MKDIRKARTIRLRGDMTVAAAMRCVVAECLRQLQENVPGIGAQDDIEYVHQARVALRRLRSADTAFSALHSADDWPALVGEAQWLAGLLGELRDLQVLIAEKLPPIAQASAESIDFAPLEGELTRRSERVRAKLRAALRSKRYRELLRHLQLWLDTEHVATRKSLQVFARKALSKRWRKVDALARRWHKLDQTQRHTLRKRIKKLRYAIEFFASLYTKKSVEKYVKYLESVQKALGNLNDIAAAKTRLRPLLRRASTAPAIGATLEWFTREEQDQHATATKTLARWKRHTPFWR